MLPYMTPPAGITVDNPGVSIAYLFQFQVPDAPAMFAPGFTEWAGTRDVPAEVGARFAFFAYADRDAVVHYDSYVDEGTVYTGRIEYQEGWNIVYWEVLELPADVDDDVPAARYSNGDVSDLNYWQYLEEMLPPGP